MRLREGHNIRRIEEGCGPFRVGCDVRLQMSIEHSFRESEVMLHRCNGWLCYRWVEQEGC